MITAAPLVNLRSFGVPKIGHSEAEWEDAAAHSEARGCFVVADGAAAAYDSRRWSHLLAAGFMSDPFRVDEPDELSPWLARRAAEWHEATLIEGKAPYYLREARDRGSHATLLAVSIAPGPRWSAVAIGDSCLLHYREGRLIDSFPISDAETFGYQPDLVATDRDSAGLALRRQGELESGDVLLAVTDAAAEWLLRYAGTPEDPAPAISAAEDTIDDLVHGARRAHRLRNDDVAIVRGVVTTAQGVSR